MRISDAEIESLNLTDPKGLATLIVGYFCTKPVPELDDSETRLIEHFLRSAAASGLNFEQLNELLLLLRQNRISEPFFRFFFARCAKPDGAENGQAALSLDDLRAGVIWFRALAMLTYGNFTFARRTLSRMDSEEHIVAALGVFATDHTSRLSSLCDRPVKILDIDPIGRDCTWFTGELSARAIARELEVAERDVATEADPQRAAWLSQFIQRLKDMRAEQRRVQRLALNNVGVYLTWDYLDVYVATSMRNTWEFEETFDFVHEVFAQDELKELKLRFFDPTQCKCSNSRDKGLLEGLMLNRAACTIYMAQEGDTLGKDSELAVTLAQGKPVIAYVPNLDPAKYAAKIRTRPLEFFEKRLKILDAEGILDDPDCVACFAEIDPGGATLDSFVDRVREYRQLQKFSLAREFDEQFKDQVPDFAVVCQLLAAAEAHNFRRRSDMLRGAHPLSMQLDMRTGTANGLLVVHSAAECAQLLYDLLTNDLDLEIVRERNENKDFTLLKERNSRCPFRVVTHNEQLTNSFWNLFK